MARKTQNPEEDNWREPWPLAAYIKHTASYFFPPRPSPRRDFRDDIQGGVWRQTNSSLQHDPWDISSHCQCVGIERAHYVTETHRPDYEEIPSCISRFNLNATILMTCRRRYVFYIDGKAFCLPEASQTSYPRFFVAFLCPLSGFTDRTWTGFHHPAWAELVYQGCPYPHSRLLYLEWPGHQSSN